MALKFLNKKGWHTGSLRNIENVWKAEQKRDAEDKKLEELRKQILEERERSEFRLLQEQAGLVPKQERLDFLYDSGLAVGKGNSEGFKALEDLPKTQTDASTSSSKTSAPGALLEDKPQSANDAWRKLHTDPLLLIKQREQEALARVQNNPIQMAMIRKSVEANKDKGQKHSKSGHKKKHKEERSMHERSYGKGQIGLEKATSDRDGRVKSNRDKYSRGEKRSSEVSSDLEHDAEKRLERRKSSPDKGNHDKYSRGEKRSSEIWSDSEHAEKRVERRKSGHDKSNHDKYSRGEKRSSEVWSDLEHDAEKRVERRKSGHDKSNHDKYSRVEKRSSEVWSDSEHDAEKRVERRKSSHDKSNHDKYSRGEKRSSEVWSDLEHDAEERVERRKSSHDKKLKDEVHSSRGLSSLEAPTKTEENRGMSCSKNRPKLKHEKLSPEEPSGLRDASRERRSHQADGDHKNADSTSKQKTNSTEVGAPTESYGRRSSGKHSNTAPKLSAEERAARLREMEMDAELHEQQRWKRLKKASEDDAREVKQVDYSGGQSFLDDARKSVYGADKGGSSTIEESVRRRSYYLQRRSEAGEQNAYRR